MHRPPTTRPSSPAPRVSGSTSPTHGGTHLDAPIHFAEGRRTADQVPLSSLITTASVVDVSAQAAADPDYQLTVDDLTAWEAEHGRLADGTALLVRTGWSSRRGYRAAYLGHRYHRARGAAAGHGGEARPGGPGLQGPQPGRARVPVLQGRGPQLKVRPVHHRLEGPGPRPRLPVHARLPRRVAHAPRAGPDALPRPRRARRRGRWPRPSTPRCARRPPAPGRARSARPTACRSTASGACSAISPP